MRNKVRLSGDIESAAVMLKLLRGNNLGYMSRSSQAFHERSKTSRKAVAEVKF